MALEPGSDLRGLKTKAGTYKCNLVIFQQHFRQCLSNSSVTTVLQDVLFLFDGLEPSSLPRTQFIIHQQQIHGLQSLSR